MKSPLITIPEIELESNYERPEKCPQEEFDKFTLCCSSDKKNYLEEQMNEISSLFGKTKLRVRSKSENSDYSFLNFMEMRLSRKKPKMI